MKELAEPSAIAKEVSDHLSEVADQLDSGHSEDAGHRHRDLRHTDSHTEDPEVVASEEVPSHNRCNVEANGEALVERIPPFVGQ